MGLALILFVCIFCQGCEPCQAQEDSGNIEFSRRMHPDEFGTNLQVESQKKDQIPIPQSAPSPADAPDDPSEESGNLQPKHQRAAHPAEFQGAGTIQLEYGYDGNFRSKDLLADQAGSITLTIAITDWLQTEFDLDTFTSQTDRAYNNSTGIGDSHAGIQITVFEETKRRPALAFAYLAKLPSASEAEGLGTGRVDHKFTGLLSRKFGDSELDFNAALLVNGMERQNGWTLGSQLALGFSRPLHHGFGIEGEISRQSLDTDQPRGVFALGALSYQANWRVTFDAGMHFGLTSDSPRYGIFASINIGVASLYRKHP